MGGTYRVQKEIVILVSSIGCGGAHRMLSLLANEWLRQGHKVTFIQTDNKNGGCYMLEDGIEVIDLHSKYKNKLFRLFSNAFKTVSIMKKRPGATLLTFLVPMYCISLVASFFMNNRIVVSERNNPYAAPKRKILVLARRWAFARADACVFQTEQARQYFPSKIQKKGLIIPNPINGDLPAPFEGKRNKTIVMACRLSSQKNIGMAIRAFERIHREYQDYSLVIYGEGELQGELEKLVLDLNLDEAVKMPGYKKDIHDRMREAAMFVSSSDYEGISNSMLEALGSGVPTIVTDCPIGGAKMMINDGENGLLVPVGDVDALYEAIKRVIEEPGLAEKISKNALKVRDDYPIEKIAREWLEVM